MTFRLAASAPVLLAVVTVVLLSCGGGGPNGGTPTDVPLPTNSQGTPLSFIEARDALAQRLDAIGTNIASVPDDVMQQLLIQCGQLIRYADRATVAQLCNAIDQAKKRADPGLIDLVVDELRALKAK